MDQSWEYFPISEHLFEYIGTQFPPPSAILYGKMSSITDFFLLLGMKQHLGIRH
jgi:hypothetical protein